MPPFAQSPFDHELVSLLLATAPPGQYAARNAIRHLDKAEDIASADPEMAAFRAITAEEESATAVFHALKRHGYPGSDSLKLRDHLQKNALGPFCYAVADLFAWADRRLKFQPRLLIEQEPGGPKRLAVQLYMGGVGLGDRWAAPQPPLNLEIRRGTRLHDFSEQIDKLAEGRKADSIRAHLRTRANMRNEILYASSAGMPSVTLNTFIEEQRRAVLINLGLFLLIDPYAEHQLFVAQTLRSFLKMIDRLPADLAF